MDSISLIYILAIAKKWNGRFNSGIRRTHQILVAENTNTFLHTNTNTNRKIKKSPGSLSEVGTFPHFE